MSRKHQPRGGSKHRNKRLAKQLHAIAENAIQHSNTAKWVEDGVGPKHTRIGPGIRYLCSHIYETVEDHIIPRRPISNDLQVTIEMADLRWRQLDKSTGELVRGSDRRMVRKTDSTLLIQGRPNDIPRQGYIREGKIQQGQNTRKTRQRVPHENRKPTRYDK
jgi:hypothetical protein